MIQIELISPSNNPCKKYKILSPGFNKIIEIKLNQSILGILFKF